MTARVTDQPLGAPPSGANGAEKVKVTVMESTVIVPVLLSGTVTSMLVPTLLPFPFCLQTACPPVTWTFGPDTASAGAAPTTWISGTLQAAVTPVRTTVRRLTRRVPPAALDSFCPFSSAREVLMSTGSPPCIYRASPCARSPTHPVALSQSPLAAQHERTKRIAVETRKSGILNLLALKVRCVIDDKHPTLGQRAQRIHRHRLWVAAVRGSAEVDHQPRGDRTCVGPLRAHQTEQGRG